MIGWDKPEQTKGYWPKPAFRFPDISKPLRRLATVLGLLAIVGILYAGTIKNYPDDVKHKRDTLSENLDKWQAQAEEAGNWPVKKNIVK